MFTYHQFDKTKDVLKEGSEIRLGGREGKIISMATDNSMVEVVWQDRDYSGAYNHLDLTLFPALEIADVPLTIDRRVLNRIKNTISGENYPKNLHSLADWLNTLEVTDGA